MRVRELALLIALLALCAGCERADSLTGAAASTTDKVAGLEAQLNYLESRVTSLSTDILVLKLKSPSTATFDPSTKDGYGTLVATGADGGVFLIIIDDVSPYLDGVRVNVRIGNIRSATYKGYTLTAKYGLRLPDFPTLPGSVGPQERKKALDSYDAALQAHNDSIKQTTVKMTEDLRPGRWNHAVLSLPRVKPTEFSYLELGLAVDQLSLAQ